MIGTCGECGTFVRELGACPHCGHRGAPVRARLGAAALLLGLTALEGCEKFVVQPEYGITVPLETADTGDTGVEE